VVRTTFALLGLAGALLTGCVSDTARVHREEMQALVGRRGALTVEVTAFNHDGDRLAEASAPEGLDLYRKQGAVIAVFPAGSVAAFRRVRTTNHAYGRRHYVEADILAGTEIVGRGLLFGDRLLPSRSQAVTLER